MAKSLSVVAHDSPEELRALLARTRDEGYRKRIRGIIRILEGSPHGEVAKALGASRTSVCSWISKYNRDGYIGLAPDKGGRPEGNPKWDTMIFNDLAKEIDAKGGYWSIPRMQEWLTAHCAVNIPGQTVWYHLDQLGYSYKSARPHPLKGDKERQKAFKKRGLFRSWSR